MHVGHHFFGLESQCGYSHDRAPYAGEDPLHRFCFFGDVRVRCELTAWCAWLGSNACLRRTVVVGRPGYLSEFYNGASLSRLNVGQIGGAYARVHVCCGDLWTGTIAWWSFEVRCEASFFPVQRLRVLMDFTQEQEVS
jgi:hypothetical protein